MILGFWDSVIFEERETVMANAELMETEEALTELGEGGNTWPRPFPTLPTLRDPTSTQPHHGAPAMEGLAWAVSHGINTTQIVGKILLLEVRSALR